MLTAPRSEGKNIYIPDEIIALIETEEGGLQTSYLNDLGVLTELQFKEKYTISKEDAITAHACNFGRTIDKLTLTPFECAKEKSRSR